MAAKLAIEPVVRVKRARSGALERLIGQADTSDLDQCCPRDERNPRYQPMPILAEFLSGATATLVILRRGIGLLSCELFLEFLGGFQPKRRQDPELELSQRFAFSWPGQDGLQLRSGAGLIGIVHGSSFEIPFEYCSPPPTQTLHDLFTIVHMTRALNVAWVHLLGYHWRTDQPGFATLT